MKFTPKGGRVSLRMDASGNDAVIKLSDTGRGIPVEFLPHVFERFRQADGSITRASVGLGLGLAIVRHIVELHGGRVSVQSAGADKGSEFTVILPALTNAVILHNTPTGLAATPSRLLDGLTVLVVEDEPDSRDLIAMVLERSGARVRATPARTPRQ